MHNYHDPNSDPSSQAISPSLLLVQRIDPVLSDRIEDVHYNDIALCPHPQLVLDVRRGVAYAALREMELFAAALHVALAFEDERDGKEDIRITDVTDCGESA